MKILIGLIALLLSVAATPARAFELEVHEVGQGVWALVGEMEQRSPGNLGNNANFGIIDTDDGLVLVDPGGSWQGAQQIERTIRGFSDKPVRLVINTGGQDHRWLGNGYWRSQGARIIASRASVTDQQARAGDQLMALTRLVGEAGMKGTEPALADETFEGKQTLTHGGVTLELHHFGQAHTPGDTAVWLPGQKILFSGDIVYLQRMLRVGSHSSIKGWIEAFDRLAEFPAKALVPGHGHPATLTEAHAHTGDYLKMLKASVSRFIEEGGTLDAISRIDQQKFMFLGQSKQLAGVNAHQVFQQLEFDF